MMWKLKQLKKEQDVNSVYYNLTNDSIGWFIPNYHTDKILRDILYNLTKKVYALGDIEYIGKLIMLPEKKEVTEKIDELEIMFEAIEKRSRK